MPSVKKIIMTAQSSGHSYHFYRLPSQPMAGTNLYCLVNRGTRVWATCRELFRGEERPGLEPATFRLQVRRLNHYATTPHNDTDGKIIITYFWQCLWCYHMTQVISSVHPVFIWWMQTVAISGRRPSLDQANRLGLWVIYKRISVMRPRLMTSEALATDVPCSI